MFIVLLKFSTNKPQAGQFMDAHNDWIARGFDDGVFLMAGGLQPAMGGGILAHDATLDALWERVNADPFVANDVVTAEIIEIAPARTDARLDFLAGR